MSDVTVDFRCPQCRATNEDVVVAGGTTLSCQACRATLAQAELRVDGDDVELQRCPVCANEEMYVQRDFNRKIGVAIVVLAAIVAYPTRGLSLLAAVLIDVGLYFVLPEITICYRCQAIVRGARRNPRHAGFDMGLEDKYRVIREPDESMPVAKP